jgi:hypothetical protein
LLLLISTFITAFAIEALGTLVSVIGLSLLFGANPIIIALAIALDVNKIINVTLLYGKWKEMGVMMRSYALIATTVTMIITSAGAYSFLSGEFQKAMLGSQEGAAQVSILKEQQSKYEARKKQIDDQIARVPDTMSARDRTRVIANFKVEQRDLQLKIADIDKQLPALQVKQISIEAKTGPIITISKAFNVTPDEAIKWVILTIIFVFDPLAVFDIVAGNFLLERRRKQAKDAEEQATEARVKQMGEVAEEVFSEPVTPKEKMMNWEPIRPVPELSAEDTTALQHVQASGDFTLEKAADMYKDVEPLRPVLAALPVVEDDPKIQVTWPTMPPQSVPDEDSLEIQVMWPAVPPEPVVPEAPEPVAVEIPTPPIFEVLEPTPSATVEPPVVVPSQPDASQAKVYTEQDLIDMGAPPEVMVAAGYEPRELITKEQVLTQHFPYSSSLNSVKADDTVMFDGGHLSAAREQYLNQS